MKIGTHSGTFHADEVLACALLRMTAQFREAAVVRTRDPAVLAGLDIVVDVGSEYDPARHRYDHHQPEFNDAFSEKHRTRLSSAGLVYKHFGREVVESFLPQEATAEDREAVYVELYEVFVEAFDGCDNGIGAYPATMKPAYRRPFNIIDQVSFFNPRWNELHTNEDVRFTHAVEFVSQQFRSVADFYAKAWLPARAIVAANMVRSQAIELSNEILVMQKPCPWKDHLFLLEQKAGVEYKCIIYPDVGSGTWRIQAVPLALDSFDCRLPLPESWRGLRDKELDAACGVDGCIFVHRTGFIGGNQTLDGALEMARKALSQKQ